MSCSILSMRIIIFDIQLKIITQNKRKRPKPCFFEKHTSVLPSSRALFFCFVLRVCARSVLLYLVQLRGFSSTWRKTAVPASVCAAQRVVGEEQKSRSGFFPSCCHPDVREGWKDERGSAGSRCHGTCPGVWRGCVLTLGDRRAPVFQAASPPCCEQTAVWWEGLEI